MAATVIQNVLVEYDYPAAGAVPNSHQVQGAYGVGFNYDSSKFTVLSDNVATSGSDIEGFLYVPSLMTNSTCDNTTKSYVAPNVPRLTNLPSQNDFAAIAVGPWTTRDCVFQYLDTARQNQAKALYTWIPENLRTGSKDTSYAAGAQPNASDPAWDLGDGGAWRSKYGFPVYAINANDAQSLMILMANYSGDIQSVPNGMLLAAQYAPAHATVRMYSLASVPSSTTLPSLWVFLLIVLGILIAVLVVASIVMRIIQKRRRRELQRMIANGDVNLEALGVARIKVTDDILNAMPIRIYVEHGGTPGPAHAPPAEAPTEGTGDETVSARRGGKFRQMIHREPRTVITSTGTQLPSQIEEKDVFFPQDTCPICIDEYENHVTPVRWLACSHIFHPACIDPLLREYSSLCPICKASVLPKDYVPEVTNVMVRRERLNRRFREIERRERERETAQPNMPVHFSGIGRFVRVNNNNEIVNENGEQAAGQVPQVNVEDVEMQNIQPATVAQRPAAAQRAASAVSASSTARRPDNVSREEWARQRAAALVGTSETVEQAEQREEARRPLWRRALGPVFPTLR